MVGVAPLARGRQWRLADRWAEGQECLHVGVRGTLPVLLCQARQTMDHALRGLLARIAFVLSS